MSKLLTTPRGAVIVRAATTADAAAVRDLRLEGLAAHPIAFAADLEAETAHTPEFWAERIASYASKQNGVLCVAAAGETLIGMMGLVTGHSAKTRHSGLIWGVYVRADWRGLGVSDALIEACADWGRAHGVQILKLGVTVTNTPAIRAYARSGFSIYGIEPKVIRYEGVLYDEFLMAKAIP